MTVFPELKTTAKPEKSDVKASMIPLRASEKRDSRLLRGPFFQIEPVPEIYLKQDYRKNRFYVTDPDDIGRQQLKASNEMSSPRMLQKCLLSPEQIAVLMEYEKSQKLKAMSKVTPESTTKGSPNATSVNETEIATEPEANSA